ncbi:MAG: ROK family protein [Candidatus Omnitrophota bacterium]|jgi:predicted NBD/HSP70 family sugar kinase|nr:ROK family protein [Candidatus Omnitrophota bacterium]MDD3982748.1 ROK family protein [Candidatus Omnitrophota bacterium]MDD5526325.1 ROK family protein [Candidatus Omnitrophota bacterium]
MLSVDLHREDYSEKEKRNIEILEILRRRGPISRPDISKEMGINVVTISNYIDDYIKRGLVYEKELDISEGGRRPALLELNSQSGYIIGVGLNLLNMVGLLVDMKGNIVTKTQIASPRSSVKDVTEAVLEIIREILRRSKSYVPAIKGIGVGIAGLVNKKDGSIHWPQRVDHSYAYVSVDLPLREIIEKEFDLPVLIENDATAACFGENWLNLGRGYRNIIYMFSGVGCGIVINGEIYTGSNGYAGEVSIYNYSKDSVFNCEAGDPCFLKRWEMDLGITAELNKLLKADKKAETEFLKTAGCGLEDAGLKNIFAAAKAGDKSARKALDGAAVKLGIKIASLVNLLNPQVVIIGGGMEEAGEDFLNEVTQTVKQWAFRQVSDNLKIVYSQLRENSVASGAASLVMQKVFARIL